MLTVSLIGYIAGLCTTIAFLPQVIHTLKTKDTQSISLGMYIMFVAGVILWLAYGILLRDTPLIIANLITLLLSSVILLIKVRDTLKTGKADSKTSSI